MNNVKERRLFDINLEQRASEEVADQEEMILEGYALKFDSPAFHGYTEVIDRHALDNADMDDVCMKYNHSDVNYILARTRNKSLELEIDDIGLKFRARLIDTQTNKDIYKMVKDGLLDKCSFAFTERSETWDYETDTRTINDIDKLFDIAVVDVPFYDSTEVYARSVDEYQEDKAKYQERKLDFAKRKLKLKMDLMLK